MTVETWDNLSNAIGRKLTNKEWTEFIAKEFNVSNSIAKQMLHAMYEVRKIKAIRDVNDFRCTNSIRGE